VLQHRIKLIARSSLLTKILADFLVGFEFTKLVAAIRNKITHKTLTFNAPIKLKRKKIEATPRFFFYCLLNPNKL
jgi:hypothetical protein